MFYLCIEIFLSCVETFDIIYPSVALKPYIRYYWYLKTDNAEPVYERVIPTGCISMVFHKANPIYSATEGIYQPQTFVCGLSDDFTDLKTWGQVEMIVVVFEPFGAKSFFSIPVNEFYNESVPVDDIGNLLLRDLQYRIQDEPDTARCIKFIEDYLIRRLYRTVDYNYKRMSAVIDVINHKPQANIHDLAQTACLSYKQFGRVFTEYIGAKPKEFSRVVRFQRALYLMQTRQESNLTQLSFESGYYDQPHLIREFKAFSGYTPTELIAVCPPYSDYFSTLR